ncbi:hypothetical protein [Leclercia sp.]|uniref:hypothetical protein n=1 Tax=Leclercia sp. TaxID=1898428 RepID=UPI002FDEEFBF
MRNVPEMETPGVRTAYMKSDGIIYMHYLVTKHALQRFKERTRASADQIFVFLDRAVIAEARLANDHRVQDEIRKAESRGGYALLDPESNTYFFIALQGNFHIVATVMTYNFMTYAEDMGICP